jgi:hypothetical protein
MTSRSMIAGAVLNLAAGALLASALPASAETLTGEIVDMACYVAHPATGRGPSHRKCADTCLKKGMPMGLLTEDKQLYLLLEDHDNPKPYQQLREKAAETVTVEGDKKSEGGVQGLVVSDVK